MPRRYLGLVFPFLLVVMPGQGPIDPGGLPGTRLLGGGGKLPAAVYARFLELAGGSEKARIVLIPTASGSVDDADELEGVRRRWQHDHPGFRFELLHTRDRAMADDEAFTAPLRAATGVWLGGGVQKNLADAYLGTRVERELQALLARGGVVGGTSAGTAIQTRTMIESGLQTPIVATGFDLVPGAISDQHFLRRNRLPRLLRVLGDHPGHFGIGVDEGTAVEIRGRELRVLGDSLALLVLAAGNGHAQRVVELSAGDQADLVSWQRAAAARAAFVAPPRPEASPNVPRGALVLVGGGRLGDDIVDRFLALAGGAAKAKVVLVPSALPPGQRGEQPIEKLLRLRGVTDLRPLDCASPREVTTTRLALLDDATAVWFGGGHQWRLVDAFAGTPAIAAFHAVLQRGGVIGGSAAGATIQGEFLVRGDPLGNTEMWCEGYDRGFAFLPGVAIDQHLLARERTADLDGLMAKLPGWVGLGIDEGTAAIVQGTQLEVLGASKVVVFDTRSPNADRAAPTPRWLTAGARLDLAAR
ncbi:MAG: cyanophycinase [Planctomycetes bacterium]|nr:cyanophycinase [Planctomycetota bacterium]